MMQMAMTLPNPVAKQLRCTRWGQDVPRTILALEACEGYRSGALGAYQVQQVLGCETRDDAYRFLKEHRVPLRYIREHLAQDCETHRRLNVSGGA